MLVAAGGGVCPAGWGVSGADYVVAKESGSA